MSLPSSSGIRRSEQLPPLSLSPPRTAKELETHGCSDDVEHSCPSLPVTSTRHTDGNNANSNNSNSSGATSISASRQQQLEPTPPGSRGNGVNVPPLSSTLAKQNSNTNNNISSDNPVQKLLPVTVDSGSKTGSSIPRLPFSITTASEGQHAALQRHPSNGSSRINNAGITNPVPSPQPSRSVVFSSSEHEPHIPPVLPQSSSTGLKNFYGCAALLTHACTGESYATARRLNAIAMPPLEGIFLQPSTFRVGATGRDVLWALYQTNGVVASYLDQQALGAAGQGGTTAVTTTTGNSAIFPPSVTAVSTTTTSAADTGSGRFVEMAGRAVSTPSKQAGSRIKCDNPPRVSLAMSSISFTEVDKGKDSMYTSRNNNTSHGARSFLEVEAEIARCLSGAGGSTPCLLSFDYIIKPARFKQFTQEEINKLRHDPLVAQLNAIGLNRLEEVVPGSSRHVPCVRKHVTHISTRGNSDAEEAEDGAKGGETPSTTNTEQQQQQRKKNWFNEIPDFNATEEAVAGAPVTLLRRRACGEAVQSCLFAARRAGSTRGKLHLCELGLTNSSSSSGSFNVHGSIRHLLSGSTISEGSRLMPTPLWNGIHVALTTMLVGEEATFVMNSGDTTGFSAPLDGAAYIQAGTSAAATAAATTTASSSNAVGSTSVWKGCASILPPRFTTVDCLDAAGTRTNSASDEHRGMTFTPHLRYRPSIYNTSTTTTATNSMHGGYSHHRKGSSSSIRRGGRPRDNSAASSSHHRSSSAASSSPRSSLVSSRASSNGASSTRGRKCRSSAFPISPKTHQKQEQQQPPSQHKSSSKFFSRVRDWGRKNRNSAEEKNKKKGKGKTEAQDGSFSAVSPPQLRQLQMPPPPLYTSPTRTYPLPQQHSSDSARSPNSISTTNTPDNRAEVPVAAHIGVMKAEPRPPQRARSPTHRSSAILPSFAPVLPEDVRAYEAASYAAVEPVVVCLRLRERIPLLSTQFTSAHSSFLISAEPVFASSEAVTANSGAAGEELDASADSSAPAFRLLSSADVGAGNACPRTTSNVPPGVLSASTKTTTTTTTTASEFGQRRSIMTEALLCLGESNLMRRSLATPFHYFLSQSAASNVRRRKTKEVTAAAHVVLASSTAVSPRNNGISSGSRATLAQMMVSMLDRVEVQNASRAALFTAVMYVMDGKLLHTRDRGHMLESGHSFAHAVKTSNNSSNCGSSNEGQLGGGDNVAMRKPNTTTVTATVVAINNTADEGKAHIASAAVPTTTAAPTQYLWTPYFRVSDVVAAFARHWNSGLYHSGNSKVRGSGISIRAVQRAVREFTQYAHYTATVSYTVAVYNAVTCTYEPYVYPLLRSTTTPTNTTPAKVTTSPDAAVPVMRSFIGCVAHPCWLDAVLQARRYPIGTDIHVVTRGHPAEAEERLFVCSTLTNITATSQEAAAAFSPPRPSTPVKAAESTADTNTSNTPAATTTTAGLLKVEMMLPITPSGSSTRPTPATTAALMTSGNGNTNRTMIAAADNEKRARSITLPALPKASNANSHVCRDTRDIADRANSVARRSLAASKQLLKRCSGEQRFCVRVLSCEPVLTPQHFFACSPKEGLAAARALLVDASVLLDYYYRAVDAIEEAGHRTGDGSTLSYVSSPAIKGLRLSTAVPQALRKHSRLVSRGQHFRQRLPYLLFGEDRDSVIAAATARAHAMGGISNLPSSSPSPSTAAPAAAADACNLLRGASDASVNPPIEVLAAAMIFFTPSAASAAVTLTSRIPLALERILLKVLPMLYLAIFLLTFGVDEGKATPGAALEQLHGEWWSQVTLVQPSFPYRSYSPKRSTTVGSGGGHGNEEDITSAAGAAATPATTMTSVVLDEAAKLLLRRYTFLGECFYYLAFVYAELPGMRSMSFDACSMALFYSPRDASLWSLWGSLMRRFDCTRDSKTALRMAMQLLEMEGEEAAGESASSEVSKSTSASHRLLEASSIAGEAGEQLSRFALLQYLRDQL